jgi:hypothetical protein
MEYIWHLPLSRDILQPIGRLQDFSIFMIYLITMSVAQTSLRRRIGWAEANLNYI